MNYFWNILASHDSSELLELLALTAVKATLLVAFAALLCLAFRRLSAATRHLLWASTLCASLLLPLLSFMKVWEVPILPTQISASNASDLQKISESNESSGMRLAQRAEDLSVPFEASSRGRKVSDVQARAESLDEPVPVQNIPVPQAAPQAEAASRLPQLINWAVAVWAAVALLLLIRLLVGLGATHLLARRAVEFKDPALTGLFSSLLVEVNLKSTVRLLRSDRTLMPIVCGILRPAVLLPAEAERWSEEQRRLVLLHELTHVTRRDCLTQMLAQVACAFYWFNPFIWSAARRLRVERERACDDYVLSVGTRPSDYARHLLEIARSMQERSVFNWAQTSSVAMARRSQLEGRLLAILSKEKKHGAMSRAATAGLVALICVLLLSLAGMRPTAVNAHHQQSSTDASASGVEKNRTEEARSNSLAIGSEPGVKTEIQATETGEAVGAQENINVADDNPQEQGLIEKQVAEDVERIPERDVEAGVKQNVVEAAAQLATTGVQIPGPNVQISPEVDPFINAEYRQESKPPVRDRQGDFIDEMASVGYTNLSIDELIRLKSSGVTADYVRSLSALGFVHLTTKEVASLSIHGVTPSYIKAIRAAGYNELTAKELTNFRIHGVTPEYIKSLRDAGYGNLTAKQLADFAAHAVTPSYISSIRAARYGNLTAKDLVTLRVHGITPEFIRQARSRLGELTLKQLVSLKIAGVMKDDKDEE